jgi:NAD(P)-dependent dehydrogenase (short-subunit alcohol dehydrogenase family)
MSDRFAGRVAVITGAAAGFGLAVATRLGMLAVNTRGVFPGLRAVLKVMKAQPSPEGGGRDRGHTHLRKLVQRADDAVQMLAHGPLGNVGVA